MLERDEIESKKETSLGVERKVDTQSTDALEGRTFLACSIISALHRSIFSSPKMQDFNFRCSLDHYGIIIQSAAALSRPLPRYRPTIISGRE